MNVCTDKLTSVSSLTALSGLRLAVIRPPGSAVSSTTCDSVGSIAACCVLVSDIQKDHSVSHRCLQSTDVYAYTLST
jgi:hypothetical protein